MANIVSCADLTLRVFILISKLGMLLTAPTLSSLAREIGSLAGHIESLAGHFEATSMEEVSTAMLPVALVPVMRIPLYVTQDLPASSISSVRIAGDDPTGSEA